MRMVSNCGGFPALVVFVNNICIFSAILIPGLISTEACRCLMKERIQQIMSKSGVSFQGADK